MIKFLGTQFPDKANLVGGLQPEFVKIKWGHHSK
jgi:hypothetical protein